MIQGIYCSQLNNNLKSEYYDALVNSDHLSKLDGVCEWAARVCYESQSKYGTSENFMKKIIESQHFDVLEHSVIGFDILYSFNPTEQQVALLYSAAYYFKEAFPYAKLDIIPHDNVLHVHIVASLRVWHDIMVWNGGVNLSNLLKDCSGKYDTFDNEPNSDYNIIEYSLFMLAEQTFFDMQRRVIENVREVEPIWIEGRLNLLTEAANRPQPDMPELENVTVLSTFVFEPNPKFNHICFETEDVSRAFTHQHVRHRKLSFSQMSQRYVDLEKTTTDDLFVKHFTTEEQEDILDKFEKYTQRAYRSLRKAGMRKEDARQVLPNMTKTRIITSGFADGIEHYLNLRTAKDAQHEIRDVAVQVQAAWGAMLDV